MTTSAGWWREKRGLLIAVAVMVPVGLVVFLAVFLPLSLWAPTPSFWWLLAWAAAVLGPVFGGLLGERVAVRRGHSVHADHLQSAINAYALVLFLASVLPLIPPDRT
jgi:hypothetical protein